jgi:hypothetical protein
VPIAVQSRQIRPSHCFPDLRLVGAILARDCVSAHARTAVVKTRSPVRARPTEELVVVKVTGPTCW